MSLRARRWLSALVIAVGLLVLVLLWAPMTHVAKTFSGPGWRETTYGILAWRSERIDYHPRRLGTRLGEKQFDPPKLEPGEEYWDHGGEFGSDVVIVRPERSESLRYPALVGTVVLSLIILWFAILLPLRRGFRSPTS